MAYVLPVTGSGPNKSVTVAEHEAAVNEAIADAVAQAVDATPQLPSTIAGGRPGQQMRAFVSAAAGAPASLTPIADVAGVTSATLAGLGQVARVDSTPAIIGTREAQAVQRGRVYRVHAYVRRLADGADPAGNTVALQLARLDAAYAQLGVITIDARILRVSDGLWHLTGIVALNPGALAGVDYTLAEGTVYVRPYVQVFTADHQTAVAQIDVVDVTEAASIEGGLDIVALAAAVELAEAEAAGAAADRVQTGIDRAVTETFAPAYFADAETFGASATSFGAGVRINGRTGEVWDRVASGADITHPTTGQALRFVPDKSGALSVTAAFVNRAGAADVLSGFQAVLSRRGRVDVPPGIYLSSGILDVSSDTRLIFDKDALLRPSGSPSSMIRVAGSAPSTFYALAGNIARGATTFALSADYGWGVGDWVEVRSDALVPGINSQADKACQLARIIYKSGNNYAVDRPFAYDFLTSDSATIGRPTMRERVVIDGAALNGEDFTSLIGFGLFLDYVADFEIIAPRIFGSKTRLSGDGTLGTNAIRMRNCVDGRIDTPTMGHIAWYGVGLSGACDNIEIDGGRGWDMRHVVSIIWGAGYGEPRNIRVIGMHGSDCTQAIFDTHDTGQAIVFEDCTGNGSRTDSGFQVRNRGTRLIRPRASGNFFDGIVARDDGSIGLEIISPDLQRNLRVGATLTGNGEPRIFGGDISNNASRNLDISAGEVRGTRMLKSTSSAIACMAQTEAPDGVRRMLLLDGIKAPAPASGHIFCSAVSPLHPFIRLRNNDLRGYNDGAYRDAGSPSEAHVIALGGSRISSDSAVRSGSFSLTAGGTASLAVGETVRRNSGPAFRPEINIFRTAHTSGTRGEIIISEVFSTSVVVRSTSADDVGTFAWTMTS